MRTKLTIVTVNYNNAPGLQRTMESVSSQDGVGVCEHVVIDGGSEDGSASLVSEYTRIYHWARGSSKRDEGIYDAMNIGTRMAQGEYVYYLNSGDVFSDSTALGRILDQLATGDPLWLVGDVLHLNGGGRVDLVACVPFSGFRFAWGRQQYNHQGTVFKRDAVLAFGGFSPEVGFAADLDLMSKFAAVGPPSEVAGVIAMYEGGGVSAGKTAASPLLFHRLRVERGSLPPSLSMVSFAYALAQVIRRQGVRNGLRIVRSFDASLTNGGSGASD